MIVQVRRSTLIARQALPSHGCGATAKQVMTHLPLPGAERVRGAVARPVRREHRLQASTLSHGAPPEPQPGRVHRALRDRPAPSARSAASS